MQEEPTGIQIPAAGLAEETLRNLVEEFVTRDGTENTDADVKVSQVLAALDRGDVEIWFDPSTKSCSLNRVR
jgi:uncharacterized protein